VNSLLSFYCAGNKLSSGRLLPARAEDLEDNRRCLNANLGLDPEKGPATRALLVLDQERPGG